MENTPQGSSSSSSKKCGVAQSSVDVYAAQCGRCFKWRKIESLEEYEKIRSKLVEDPFYCEKMVNVSCDSPEDIQYDSSRTWVIDKPDLPKSPEGFKRTLVMRKDYSKLDAYYITPTGKRLRTMKEIAAFLKTNKEYNDVSLADFDFSVPKILEDTVPQDVQEKRSQRKKRR